MAKRSEQACACGRALGGRKQGLERDNYMDEYVARKKSFRKIPEQQMVDARWEAQIRNGIGCEGA